MSYHTQAELTVSQSDQDEQLAYLLEEASVVPLMGTDTEEFLVWANRLDEAASECGLFTLAEAAREKAAWFRTKYALAEAYFGR